MLLINNFTARTRLATFEEKLLQQTIRYVEKNVRPCEMVVLSLCVYGGGGGGGAWGFGWVGSGVGIEWSTVQRSRLSWE